MNVFLTGGTGLIGRELARVLMEVGHAVTALSRSPSQPGLPSGVTALQGDPTLAGPWQDVLARCDACVHLAGSPVAAGRWTEERKRAIRDSRVESTRRVVEVLGRGGPSVLVSGSAIGYYGARGDEPLDESSAPGEGFLAEVCKEWEAAALAAPARVRAVTLRTGIVLAKRGGALEQMLLPFRFFAGGPIGKGEFWQSWIHLADEVELIRFALEDARVAGPLNATAPEPVRNRDFAHALGRAMHRPAVVPVPIFGMKLALGELASVVTTGQRVLPKKALQLGFKFRFPHPDEALADLLR